MDKWEQIDDQSKKMDVKLQSNGMEDKDLKYLCTRRWVQGIERLEIYDNNIGPKGMHYVAVVKWKHLKLLQIGGNEIGDKGCKYLSKAKLAKLETLTLDDCQIGNSGIIHLSKMSLKKMNLFCVYRNRYIGEVLKYLIRMLSKKVTFLALTTDTTYEDFIELVLTQSPLTQIYNSQCFPTEVRRQILNRLYEKKFGTPENFPQFGQ